MKNIGVKAPILVFISVCIGAFLLAGGFALPPSVKAAETGCVKCHTSDKLLKALHKPPRAVASEGEG